VDRLFLDANILFSAAYRPDTRLNCLWFVEGVQLVTSDYALTEALRNLESNTQFERLDSLIHTVELIAELPSTGLLFAQGVNLPEKDWPILLAAMSSNCTHLITGDRKHFGQYFGDEVSGVRIMTPASYLKSIIPKR